jgi:threonine dehydratase
MASTDNACDGALRQRLDAVRARIAPFLHRTPLVASQRLSALAGRPVLLKLENLQKTGSFKARGFMHRVQEHRSQGGGGVLTFSSGNAAQGLAYAAGRLGCPAVVVMTPSANPAKVAATQGYGARIVFAESLASIAEDAALHAAREGFTLIHPYDDSALMTGHASLGLELLEEMPAGATVITAVGGGGMAGGLALAARAHGMPFRLVTAEPVAAVRLQSALEAGRPVPCAGMSIAEGLCPPSIGHACFELIRQTAAQHVLVQEEEIRGAMRALLECMKVLAEPSGATALAAALSGQIEAQGEGPLVVIVSGGNIDMERLKTLL